MISARRALWEYVASKEPVDYETFSISLNEDQEEDDLPFRDIEALMETYAQDYAVALLSWLRKEPVAQDCFCHNTLTDTGKRVSNEKMLELFKINFPNNVRTVDGQKRSRPNKKVSKPK